MIREILAVITVSLTVGGWAAYGWNRESALPLPMFIVASAAGTILWLMGER